MKYIFSLKEAMRIIKALRNDNQVLRQYKKDFAEVTKDIAKVTEYRDFLIKCNDKFQGSILDLRKEIEILQPENELLKEKLYHAEQQLKTNGLYHVHIHQGKGVN